MICKDGSQQFDFSESPAPKPWDLLAKNQLVFYRKVDSSLEEYEDDCKDLQKDDIEKLENTPEKDDLNPYIDQSLDLEL